MHFLGIEPITMALVAPSPTVWAWSFWFISFLSLDFNICMKWKIESSVESNACYCSYFEQFIHARLIFYSFFDLVIPYQNVITGSSGETADFFLVTYARLHLLHLNPASANSRSSASTFQSNSHISRSNQQLMHRTKSVPYISFQ